MRAYWIAVGCVAVGLAIGGLYGYVLGWYAARDAIVGEDDA